MQKINYTNCESRKKARYKEWYEKTKPQRKIWEKEYYKNNKEHIIQVHKAWAEKNVDSAGTVWRKYSRWARLRNSFTDREYRIRKKLLR